MKLTAVQRAWGRVGWLSRQLYDMRKTLYHLEWHNRSKVAKTEFFRGHYDLYRADAAQVVVKKLKRARKAAIREALELERREA